MQRHYLHPLDEFLLPSHIGNKAATLLKLARHNFNVPTSWVCTWDAYERYLADDTEMITALRAELTRYVDEDHTYAVRSSANLEDGTDTSFAGQFKSVLNVRGVDNVASAIWSIWATTRTPSTQAYLKRHAIDPETLKMAVLIQEMVPPSFAGVVFSRDPMTGEPVQVIEAVRGSGEQLMQGGVTPERWVRSDGQWREAPSTPLLPQPLAAEIASQAAVIESLVSYPSDIEWVYDGDILYWLQLREITTLRNASVYSNRISREYMPGVTLPLVWSVNVPLVNGAWIELLTEIIGPNTLTPEKLAKSIRYHAYFNMSALGDVFEQLGLPRESLEQMRNPGASQGRGKPSFRPTPKMIRLLPRMIRFLVDKLGFERQIEPFLQRAKVEYRDVPADRLDARSIEELLNEIQTLRDLNRRTAYFNVVTPIIMQILNGFLRKRLAKFDIPVEHVDLRGDSPEFADLDPAPALRTLKAAYERLPLEIRMQLKNKKTRALNALSSGKPEVAAFKVAFDRFIVDFGHLSDSGNDFSSPRWHETPDLILDLVMDYRDIDRRTGSRLQFEDLDIPFLGKRRLRRLKKRTQRYMLYREKIGSLYTYGQSLFRIYFLALGRKMTTAGWLDEPENLFYLYWNEITDWMQGSATGAELASRVRQRREEVETCQDIEMPEIIYGNAPPPPVSRDRAIRELNGTPTSPGRYRGPACIVHGIRDFAKVQPGDVLVVPFTDVGWTPLFTKAGAVVAESGGMLSHSSIIAREYEIPAVVSINYACRLITDGAPVLVDGYHGRVFLERKAVDELEADHPTQHNESEREETQR